ncbi:uncharacterized protein BX664DRAFT_336249 [Halteromyces radiatus]|uniref:uncharacterized protein n=1 Tax=Halteromyces radiatus TaxID=101107 RepID=UPI00221F65A2|nr:uncharacterized protein BX664DRAFT_336249 [Halteromyces radiatus]KAI8086590.1 hypothetical protein BX664DRAFT_336249 [Halteromyces radiatus]
MPLRVVGRINTQLSYYFYNYGKACASRMVFLLVTSFCMICFFSLPTILLLLQTAYNNAIPIPLSLDTFDGQFWLFSPHIQQQQPDLTLTETTVPEVILKQVRLTNLIQQVDKELLLYAHRLQQVLTTTCIQWNQQPLSLESICHHTKQQPCLVHSPLLYWSSPEELENDSNWLETVNQQIQRQKALSSSFFGSQNNNNHNTSKITFTPLSSRTSTSGLSMQPFSLFGNVTLDLHGNIISADSILLTFALQLDQTSAKDYTNSAWNALWNEVVSQLDTITTFDNDESTSRPTAWFQQANIRLQTWYYKSKLLPLKFSSEVQLTIVAYVVLFYLVSTMFAKSSQVKSHYLFGLAALFLSATSCTTTLGILHHFGVELTSVPWYLCFIICGVASLENIFLITTAVLDAGCDMQVKEKIARGLQSIGVPMTAMLFAEILILSLGCAMDSVLVQEFCLFGKVALLVDYILEFTFFIAVLSIDVKRVELTDLDDRQISKRLHELSNCDIDAQQNPDFCPIHDSIPDNQFEQPKTCADCKEFKTHRTVNAVLLCVVILGLSLFRQPSIPPSSSLSFISLPALFNQRPSDNDIVTTANQFWNVINPTHDTWKISVLPPHLVVYNRPTFDTSSHSNINFAQVILNQIEAQYNAKEDVYFDNAHLIRSSRQSRQPPSLFRSMIYRTASKLLSWMLSVNIPFLLLCLMSVVVTMWLMPGLRRRWVVPIIKRIASKILIKLMSIIQNVFTGPSTSLSAEYDANGVHLGAISAQRQFNEQHKSNITSVDIKTLSGKHAADLRLLGTNGKHGTVISCDQDGRIILWDAVRSIWIARLDRLEPTLTNGGALLGDLNPDYYSQPRRIKKWQRAFGAYQQEQLQRHHHRSSSMNVIPGCVKIDQGNRWVIAAYDDGSIRVWNVTTGTLACQLDIPADLLQFATMDEHTNVAIYETNHHHQQSSIFSSPAIQNIRRRRINNLPSSTLESPRATLPSTWSPSSSHDTSSSSSSSSSSSFRNSNSNDKRFGFERHVDRILAVQFVGVVAEYCHPLVAELAAQQQSMAGQSMDPNTSQNYLVSVHKSGMIREWDLLSGECIQSFASGHLKEISCLHTVECKAPHRKLGVTWVFTASKDGTVKCWERKILKDASSSCSVGGTDNNTSPSSTSSSSSSTASPSSSSSTTATTSWICLYSIDAHEGQSITAINTSLPVGGMGVLVTGSNQGSVKVWNFETGELVCILSKGNPSTTTKVNNTRYQSRSSRQQQISDHFAGITQIVVTRYCDVDTGPGLCRGCDTCFGNGFFIASSASNETVHVWRLERSGGGHEHNCSLCSKDYHRQQYRRTKKPITTGEDDQSNKLSGGGRRRQQQRRMSHSSTSSTTSSTTATVSTNTTSMAPTTTRRIRRHRPNVRMASTSSVMDDMVNGLLDIEQLAGNDDIDLTSVFLGKIHHVAGCNLVFCDNMVLAGVRRKSTQQKRKYNTVNEWQAWFVSLQYYEPPSDMTDTPDLVVEDDNNELFSIPIEAFDLEPTEQVSSSSTTKSSINDASSLPSKETLVNMERTTIWKMPFKKIIGAFRTSPLKKDHGSDYDDNEDNDDEDSYSEDSNDDLTMDDDIEAKEMLPFSTIEHVVSMDGLGLACDYGNFIKVVCLDRSKLAAQRRQQQSMMAGHPMMMNDKYSMGWPSTCDTGDHTSSMLSPLIKNNNDGLGDGEICQCKTDGSKCCGGKHGGNGKCCGGKSRKGIPSSTSCAVTAGLSGSTVYEACSTSPYRPLTECIAKATCSRAGECHLVSSSTAKSLRR